MSHRTPRTELTDRERECFVWLAAWLLRGDLPPSVREMACGLEIGHSRAHQLLVVFEQFRLIARVRKKPDLTGLTNKGRRVYAETANGQPAVLEQKNERITEGLSNGQ